MCFFISTDELEKRSKTLFLWSFQSIQREEGFTMASKELATAMMLMSEGMAAMSRVSFSQHTVLLVGWARG